ncbi:MAG: SDR family NAD(P)-dependent oxidoreductase, partial [Pseudomonadota bacterium]
MQNKNYKDENIWIIGASSGIGEALALDLSRAGAYIILSARREDKLKEVSAKIGEGHSIIPLDIADAAQVATAAQSIWDQHKKIDRIIFMAALYDPMALDELDLEKTQKMVQVNLMGAFHVIDAVLPYLKKQDKGQLALCASVAGYMGLPKGQPYSATKAAMINIAETLKIEAPEHLDIKLINPGFVKTALTDKNDFKMPMLIAPQQAAGAITKGLLQAGFEIHFPRGFTRFLKFIRSLPYFIQLY